MIRPYAALALLLVVLVLPALVTAQYADEATTAALLAWCEADPGAYMCTSGSWRAGSDPCTDGWDGVECDANGAVIQL
jgi:hypothetical protein